MDHLQNKLRQVTINHGEGLMLRKPRTLYEPGRSYTLLKVKQLQETKALMLYYEFKRGVLQCLLPRGHVKLVKFDSSQRNVPKPNTVVSIAHYGTQTKLKNRI